MTHNSVIIIIAHVSLLLMTQYFPFHINTVNINLLKPNVNYSGRTAPLTSKVAFYIYIQQI